MTNDLSPLYSRLSDAEREAAEETGRNQAKWESRDRQDVRDDKRFHTTKLIFFATLGGTASGAAFNFFF